MRQPKPSLGARNVESRTPLQAAPCRPAWLDRRRQLWAGASPSSRAAAAAPAGQVWALALPDSVKTVKQAQLNGSRPRRHNGRRVQASAGVLSGGSRPRRSGRSLTVIAPKQVRPRRRASRLRALRTCAASASTAVGAVKARARARRLRRRARQHPAANCGCCVGPARSVAASSRFSR